MDAASMSRALPQMRSGKKNTTGAKPEAPFRQNGMQIWGYGLEPEPTQDASGFRPATDRRANTAH
jgi:hypothetical protein